MNTKTKLAVLLLGALLVGGCSSSDGDGNPDGSGAGDAAGPGSDTGGTGSDATAADAQRRDGSARPGPDQGTVPKPDAARLPDGQVAAGQIGAVCTQQAKTCGPGLKCVFLESWNAPKGTCVRELTDGCQSWDDARCVVSGANYSVMCGPYSENNVTTHICFLLCSFNGKTYDCPPNHTCKVLKGYSTCVPQ